MSHDFPVNNDLDESKRGLRRRAEDRRAAIAASVGADAGARLAVHFLNEVAPAKGAAVAGYWPMRHEIDPRPLMERLHALGHPCLLPVTDGPDRPLRFRRWTPETVLVPAAYGTSVPPPEAPEIEPQILLIPLLAFDREGWRLGYGGGYYDRTLKALRRGQGQGEWPGLAAGLAYADQETVRVPRGPRDQPLDWIVTESAARRLNRARA